MDLELFGLLNEDEEIGYGFDEPDELTHAHAVTINRSQGGEHSAWSSPGDQRVADLAAHPGPLSLSPRTSAFTAHVLAPLGTRSLIRKSRVSRQAAAPGSAALRRVLAG
jgi:hypothetical protein